MIVMNRTMAPELVRMALGADDALVGAGKIVFCDHDKNSIYGGVSLDKLDGSGNWEMAMGTMIFVPIRRFVALPSVGGWDLCDILTDGGLHPEHWKDK